MTSLFRMFRVALLFAASLSVAAAALQHVPAVGPEKGPPAPQGTTAQGTRPSGSANPELTPGANEAAERRQEAGNGPAEVPEDEEAAFKYSPAVRGIAKITGLSLVTAYWVCIFINFAIVAAAILFAMKSNLPAMFRGRTQEIQKGMQEARRASEEAKHRLQAIEARLSRMNLEIGEMQAQAESQARAEEERLRASIEEEKRNILQSAEQEVAQATNAARRELQKYAVVLAVEMAEKGIRIDPAEDRLLVEDFAEQLASEARHNGGKG